MSAYDDWDRSYNETLSPVRRRMADYNWNSRTRTGECLKCAATVSENNLHRHSDWHTDVEKGIQVSNVKWCDFGDHAFKANTPGALSFTGQQNDENGLPQTVQMDVCGIHSGKVLPSQQEASTVREIESAYRQQTIDGNFTD